MEYHLLVNQLFPVLFIFQWRKAMLNKLIVSLLVFLMVLLIIGMFPLLSKLTVWFLFGAVAIYLYKALVAR
jgi:hypothetical protein